MHPEVFVVEILRHAHDRHVSQHTIKELLVESINIVVGIAKGPIFSVGIEPVVGTVGHVILIHDIHELTKRPRVGRGIEACFEGLLLYVCYVVIRHKHAVDEVGLVFEGLDLEVPSITPKTPSSIKIGVVISHPKALIARTRGTLIKPQHLSLV